MNKDTLQLISSLEALFTCQVKMADAHGLDKLPNISLARGREILTQLRIEKAKLKQSKSETGFFNHLDNIHA